MKEEAIHHLAMDVHQATIVACVRDERRELSELLRAGSLESVYHGAPGVLTLKELVRNDNSLVEEATPVMLQIEALFRARAHPDAGSLRLQRGQTLGTEHDAS